MIMVVENLTRTGHSAEHRARSKAQCGYLSPFRDLNIDPHQKYVREYGCGAWQTRRGRRESRP